jgi:hypothetical protein
MIAELNRYVGQPEARDGLAHIGVDLTDVNNMKTFITDLGGEITFNNERFLNNTTYKYVQVSIPLAAGGYVYGNSEFYWDVQNPEEFVVCLASALAKAWGQVLQRAAFSSVYDAARKLVGR